MNRVCSCESKLSHPSLIVSLKLTEDSESKNHLSKEKSNGDDLQLVNSAVEDVFFLVECSG